jgi:hypothetical protein
MSSQSEMPIRFREEITPNSHDREAFRVEGPDATRAYIVDYPIRC